MWHISYSKETEILIYVSFLFCLILSFNYLNPLDVSVEYFLWLNPMVLTLPFRIFYKLSLFPHIEINSSILGEMFNQQILHF